MSTSVDNRVVQLQFDNRQFEKNVKGTLNSLDKLKNGLKMDGATKGLEEVDKVSKKCGISRLGDAADAVRIKMNAMSVVGITAISNITNKAIDAAERMLKSFTISPIRDGFKEYELKMGSIQTIMASTGESVSTVNKYLEELNEYSDKTIYSFADMTQNIGKFTNAGVKLEDAVKAIQGISNVAAVSGATASEASHAMYNFAQALSAGSVKLLDWKSIETANISTREFKNELIKTAVELGTLVQEGDRFVSTTTDMTGHVSDAFHATSMFNESLSSQWLTTDVLITTLGRYSDATTDIGKKAFAAAQDVKTFSQLLDTLKESVGSGWSQISEIIFGDIKEATELWTSINNVFSGAIDRVFTKTHNFLRSNLSSGYKNFLAEDIIPDIGIFEQTIKDVAETHKEGMTQMIEDAGGFEQSLKNNWLNVTMLKESVQKYTDSVSNMSDAELENANITEDQRDRLIDFNKELQNGDTLAQKLINTWTKQSGRMNFIKGIAGLFTPISQILNTIKTKFKDIFGDSGTSKWLFNFSESFYNFTQKIKISDATLEKFGNGLHKIFTHLKSVTDRLKPLVATLKDIVKTGVGAGMRALLHGFKTLGRLSYDGARSLYHLVDSSNILQKAFNGVNKIVTSVRSAFKSLFADEHKFEFGTKMVSQVVGSYKKVTDGLTDISSKINSPVSTIRNALKKVTDGVSNFTNKIIAVVKHAVAYVRDELDLSLKDILKFALSFAGLKVVASFAKSFAKITDVVHKVADTIDTVGEAFADLFKGVEKDIHRISKAIAKERKSKALEHTSQAILNIAISVGILAASVWLLHKVGGKDLVKPVGIIIGLMVALSALMVIVNKIGGKSNSIGLASVAALILALGIVTKMISEMTVEGSLIKKILILREAMYTLIILCVTLALVSKFSKGAIGAAVATLVLVGALSKTLRLMQKLSDVDVGMLLESLKKIGILLLAFMGVMIALRLAGSHAAGAGAAIFLMTISVGLLIPVIVMLAALPVSMVKKASKTLAMIFGVFGLLMAFTAFAGANAHKAAVTILAMSVALIPIAAVVAILGYLDESAVKQGTACISALIAMMSILVLASSTTGKSTKSIIALTVMVTMLGGLLIALTFVAKNNANAMLTAVNSLIRVMAAMSALMLVVGLVKVSPKTLTSLYLMTGVIALLSVILGGLSMIKNVDTLESVTNTLIKLMTALGVITMLAALIGPACAAATQGVIAMAAVLGEMVVVLSIFGVIAGAVGALLIYNENLQTFINTGIDLFVSLAEGIGRILAAFVAGAAKELLDVIPYAADTLHDFAVKMVSVSAMICSIPNTFVDKLQMIAQGILAITAAELLDGMANLNPFHKSFEELPETMSAIGQAINDLVSSVDKGVDLNKVNTIVQAGSMIASMAKDIPNTGGLIGAIVGNNDLAEFAKGLKPFGEAVVDMSSVGKIDGAKVIQLCKLGKKVAEMASEIPNQGLSVVSVFVGDNDLATFAEGLKPFGESVADMSSVGKIDEDKVKSICTCGSIVAKMASELPNSGGLAGLFAGNNDLDTFAEQMKPFADTVVEISNSGDVSLRKIRTLVTCGTEMVKMAQIVKDSDMNLKSFWGHSGLVELADGFVTFGDSVKAYDSAVSSVKSDAIINVNTAIASLVDLLPRISGLNLDNISRFNSVLTNMGDSLKKFKMNSDVDVSGGISAIGTIVSALHQHISAKTSEFVHAGMVIVKSIGNGIIRGGNLANDAITVVIRNVANRIKSNLPFITLAGYETTISYARGFTAGTQNVYSAVSALSNTLINSFRTLSGSSYNYGRQFSVNYSSGMLSALSQISSTARSIITTACNELYAALDVQGDQSIRTYRSGTYFTNGFRNGIRNRTSVRAVEQAAWYVGNRAVRSLNQSIDAHSPAKESMRSGRFFDLGMAVGIRDNANEVQNEAHRLGILSLSAVNNAVYRINDAMENSDEFHPVISPILDLSDVTHKARQLDSVINSNQLRCITTSRQTRINDSLHGAKNITQQFNNNFTQNNYSPKSLSRTEIYRQTRNQLSLMRR